MLRLFCGLVRVVKYMQLKYLNCTFKIDIYSFVTTNINN